ncbi:MAG TPA: amidohydrolase family protein [Pyrinomonadaceae bacterium]|nr:amidohydrolase family protein [Pyrinomonadaceae bacterium]
MKLKPSLYAAIGIVLLLLPPVAARAQVTAIKAGKLVDPATGTVSANQVIIVDGRKIKAVGAGLQIPAGTDVIDLSKMTVLPGLFDCHTHMLMNWMPNARLTPKEEALLPTSIRTIQGVVNARGMLEAGFTTIRDVGNAPDYADTSLRLAINGGHIPGPTIINAGQIIAPFGGQDRLWPGRPDVYDNEYIFADTRDELVKAIRRNIHYGARVIKIVVDDQGYKYSADDIKFIVEEARKSGLKVAAHCATDEGARNAILGGVASIEHGQRMSDETLELMKKTGTVLVGTDFPEGIAKEQGYGPNLAPTFLDRLRRAHKIGVTMAFGTDVLLNKPDKSRGAYALDFLEDYVKVGMPAGEILRMMTTNSAVLLGVEKERGAIKEGLAADIIATPENPLDDIQTLKQVSFVMKDGKVVKPLRPR